MATQAKGNVRNRRRLGARTYKNYSEEMLQLAVDLVKSKKTTSYDAEKNFGIPRRTIEKRVKNLHSNKPGPRFRFSPEEENKFIKVLIAAGDFGCPLSMLDLKLMIFEYLKKNQKTYLFNDKLPGDWWVKNFLRRHKDTLTLRSTQNISRARAEKTLEEFQDYFKNLEISLQNLPPSHILNYDETNVSDDPGSTKSIFRRGIKYPERIINHSKGCISLMFAATAAGDLLPPYVVYKAEHLWSEWCKDGPEGACYNRSRSGWFDSIVFFDWFNNIIVPWANQLEGEKLVIGDNLSSHLNAEVVELCEKHQIRFSFLPSRSTQLTQPLDVAFFAPLKKAWREILLKYKTENPKQISLNKSHFPLLLKQLMEILHLRKQNIMSGFKATGIHPFNPYEVYKRIPEYEGEIKYDIDETLLNFLKENKQPNPIIRNRNKKLNVAPGKSVKSSDITLFCTKKMRTTKKTLNQNTTANLTCEDPMIEQQEVEKLTFEVPKDIKTSNTSAKIPQQNKTLKKHKYYDDSSDSNSSCTVSAYDTSEYDPKNDDLEDVFTDIEKDMDTEMLDSVQSVKYTDLKLEHENVQTDKTTAPSDVEIIDDIAFEEVSEEIIKNKGKFKGKGKVTLLSKTKEVITKNKNKFKGKGKVTVLSEIKEEITKNESKLKGKGKVKILSEIKNTPENSAYFDLSKYGPLTLKPIDKNMDAIICSKLQQGDDPIILEESNTENIGPTAGCSYDFNKVNVSYSINDHIMARYITKKKVQYYVGKIIDKHSDSKYKVSFYKRFGKNDNIRFKEIKTKDIDIIDKEMIVKSVHLMAINEEESEFVFNEDDDLVYFD